MCLSCDLCEGSDWSTHGLVGNPEEAHGNVAGAQGRVGGAVLLAEEGVHL